MWQIIRVKRLPYDLTLSHNTSATDNRQMDRQQLYQQLDHYLRKLD